ncbi:hypothetical protein HF251_23115 [Rhizobium leguminosarum]|uniref:hypothetical protein n=1 Tax=Rhizobium leguminosarum TaxID=384 RepID=UPI001C913C60|nr:hypothetical protein [Rhizobium leguminosarum]MBY2965551.1 hypothetical protein [Rhizobium leguminosarum]
MRYKVSRFRKDFNVRTAALVSAARQANRKGIPTSVRDLAFQCAILQTSAATEEYIRTLFEAWAFMVRNSGAASSVVPTRTRIAVAKSRLEAHFASYVFNSDEKAFLSKLEGENDLWTFLSGGSVIPGTFVGKVVFDERKYPSPKNVKVLFSRIGIDNVFDLMSALLRADAEYRLVSFNSIRTALAHANPPQLTLPDVKRNVDDMQSLVGAFDRILHKSLSNHFGQPVW